jgi:hypothetical protein
MGSERNGISHWWLRLVLIDHAVIVPEPSFYGFSFPLDLWRPRGHTPATRMLFPEMDSWGRVAAARVKEDETYRDKLHPVCD